MAKFFTLEVTKTIVITVESDNYDMARDDARDEIASGEYDHSWHRAESKFELIGEGEEE